MSYLVVDNFCDDLERVVASVHNAGFDTWNPNRGEVGSSVYEGMGFWGDHALMLRSLTHTVGGIVIPNSMFFRVTNEGMERAYIHSDRESGNHTCIAYLSQHDQASGTAFYRHKPSGLTEMPAVNDMTPAQWEALKADMVSRDPDKWEQVDYVSGRYNRALIFKAPLFHSRFPLEGIGADTTDGRLIWASHFFKLGANGELF